MWAIKHTNGLFLHIQYITPAYKRSFVQLVKSGFVCFETEAEANQYIVDGKQAYYSYKENEINQEDLKAVQFTEKTT